MTEKHSVTEFNPKSTLQDWRTCYRQGKLLEALKKHWKEYVPQVYDINNDPLRVQRLEKRLLLRPMEMFLTNNDANPEEDLQCLKEQDRPSQKCGHVFKNGEATYSCRDCASDPTCVLCIKCFENSHHKDHRYRMHTSGGGGYCDCGDKEAWKDVFSCSIHQPEVEGEHDQRSPMETLPDDLVDRASTLFRSTLSYAVDLLMWEQSDSLPPALQPNGALSDEYITMLFNDEVHTYDQVIEALKKAIQCSRAEATDFATIVDREGRSSVRNGTFQECERVRTIIERYTSRHASKPLRVQVMHRHVVAFQKLALSLLPWLREIIRYSDGLRQLFCELSMQNDNDDEMSLMQKILLADTKLWKGARVESHQLFMSGILMDETCKVKFAVMFTKHYNDIMRAFVVDDHYRSVSVTSISVQIYTVPTIARMLIEDHNLLAVIMNAFMENCENKKNTKGKLTFDQRNIDRNLSTKRTWYILYDFKYALISVPNTGEWNENLIRNYMNGFYALLNLLKSMQGMDEVVRQTGQHIEFEPEWETAFNLQLKLDGILSLVAQWTCSNRDVMVQSVSALLNIIHEDCEVEMSTFNGCDHSTEVINYKVASEPVSIHLPITRLLAALYVHLSAFNLSIYSPEFPNNFDIVKLIELPLRVSVLVAQVHAGMWRRNGFSLINQLFFYHNVKCRSEMHDKDLVVLQIGASLLNSDDFLLHLMNKFSLSNWAKKGFKLSVGEVYQITTLAEEFLSLLIHIISERFVVGVGVVTEEDILKREIIHQLCISPLSHSELVKALPEDENNETGIEKVINEVAIYRVPTERDKGKYELKEDFYEWYNPYYYHYNKADQSKSEETQLSRKRTANQSLALPPPKPPRLSRQFANVKNILHCDTMIYMMEMILMRPEISIYWSEAQLERVLHLIGLALHESKIALRENDSSFQFLAKATRDMAEDKSNPNIKSLLETLHSHNSLSHDSQKDLLSWTVKMFAEVTDTEDITPATQQSYIKKRHAERAEKRRAKIMAQMSALQRNFIQENMALYDSVENTALDVNMDTGEMGGDVAKLIAIGPSRSTLQSITPVTKVTCIVCQEEQDISIEGKCMVLAAFVQQSSVLSHNSSGDHCIQTQSPLIKSDLSCGLHTSTCGHAMHAECWQTYYESIVTRESRRSIRRQMTSFDIEKNEFLCPLCEFLSNTVIPVVPALQTLGCDRIEDDVHINFNDWLDAIYKTVDASISDSTSAESQSSCEDEPVSFIPKPMSAITKLVAESVARNFQMLWNYVTEDFGNFSDGIKLMVKKFATDICSVSNVQNRDGYERLLTTCWSTCAYTIMSTENVLRFDGQLINSLSSRQDDTLNSVVKVAAIVNQIVPIDVTKSYCVHVLRALSSANFMSSKSGVSCLLELDMFHCLVALTMSLPSLHTAEKPNKCRYMASLLPFAGLNDLHALQLTLTSNLVKIILSPWADDYHEEDMETDAGEDIDTESEALRVIFRDLFAKVGCDNKEPPPGRVLQAHVQKSCLPFLRCSALLYHYISGIPLPTLNPGTSEFQCICSYLSLNTSLSCLLLSQGDVINQFVHRWCTSERLKDQLATQPSLIISFPSTIKSLISLPNDYSDLINLASTFTCPRTNEDDSRAPTMCLVCEKMLCSQSYCCQTPYDNTTLGAAMHHSITCGAGTGIFLRVRDCQIVLLKDKTKGCFYPPPYVDIYRETDEGLRRGNPLYLSPEAYKRLQLLWLNNGISEEIGHQLQSHVSLLAIEWQNL